MSDAFRSVSKPPSDGRGAPSKSYAPARSSAPPLGGREKLERDELRAGLGEIAAKHEPHRRAQLRRGIDDALGQIAALKRRRK